MDTPTPSSNKLSKKPVLVFSDVLQTMAAFSAIKNKKNQKLREGIEDLALKCGDTNDEDSGVQLIDVKFLYQDQGNFTLHVFLSR